MDCSSRLMATALIAAASVAGALHAAHAASKLPEVMIAASPLSAGGSVHPNMLLSISGEFTISAIAHRGLDGVYDRSFEYAGYFNPLKCYRYHGGNRNTVDGYFAIAGNADKLHECGGDKFSGNFMNWAASSTLDILRYALTGGDRVVDTPDKTILQRAFLKPDFYANAAYFPRRAVTGMDNASVPHRVTPFRTSSLFIVSCGNRILFSDSVNRGNDCDTPAFDDSGRLLKTDKKLGEYLVRVQVCDQSEGADRVDLCQRYGKHFKPIGELQRHAEKIRFAAMGYLLDDSERRYGGVLRAPMKYIGANKFDAPGFTASANEHLEWDPATGVLYANPDAEGNRSSTNSRSGIINYLNRMGRAGKYKAFDPVGELYYEGLRYLQGKPPTLDATRGMSEAMKDDFPVVESWKDPAAASCQRNYIVSIADANSHWDRYIPGNDRTTFNRTENAYDLARLPETAALGQFPALDVKQWTRKLAGMEVDASGSYGNRSPRRHLGDLEDADTGFGGHGTYYMSGLAYWANTNDIRLDKPVRVKTFAIDLDEGGNGLIDGSSRLIQPRDSQLYLAAKYGGFEDANRDGNPFAALDADGSGAVQRSDAEWDRNGTGTPANYFLAYQPGELIRSIRKLFARVSGGVGISSGIALSTSRISPDGTFAYQAGFKAARWSGNLKKFAITRDGSGAIKIGGVPVWDAAETLTGKNGKPPVLAPDDRRIYTSKSTSRNAYATIPFEWSALTSSQRASLDRSPVDHESDGHGKERLNYLRGERSLELGWPGGRFRVRDSVLGDIVNSRPVYVGTKAAAEPSSARNTLSSTEPSRTGAVYVGANDGMLHAFDASNGAELFSYIPDALIPRLHELTAPDYLHQPYVDGAITVGDAMVFGQPKTVLASGMGGGAQGVFALDVSDPSDFSGGAGVLWEFTDRDDPDIGNLFGAPVIAKFMTKLVKGMPEHEYFVVVPSGLNNYRDDGAGAVSESGQSALFLLSLDKTPSAKWKLGFNYFKIKLPMPEPDIANGLAAPALAVGNDGAVRFAYAGDLQGNLWRFDFTGVSPWRSALGTSSAKPVFVARDADGTRQPITVQPRVVFAPGGGYVILFGTGKFIEDADTVPGSFKTQSVYGVLDTGGPTNKASGRDELVSRVLSRMPINGGDAVNITGIDFNFGIHDREKKGWYFDFPESSRTGERVVTSTSIANRSLIFNTLIPGIDPCFAGGGRTYFLNTLTGLPSTGRLTGYLSEAGLTGAPVLMELPAEVGARDPIGRRKVRKKVTGFNSGGAEDEVGKPIVKPPGVDNEITLPAGRLGWREIINWQELHDAINEK